MDSLTFGQLRDLLQRAHSVIHESEGADEHMELLVELHEAFTLIRDEVSGSHMGTGADVVVIERSDSNSEEVSRG